MIKAHQGGSHILSKLSKETQQDTVNRESPSPEALQFIESMLATDPKGMSIPEALCHPFITGDNVENGKNYIQDEAR